MTDSPRLSGKVIVITGAGRGIGRAIARLCAEHEAAVVVNDLGGGPTGEGSDQGPANDVVGEIRAAGGKAWPNQADITAPDGAQTIITDALEQFGRIDGVVNNAGFLRDSIFHQMGHKDFEDVVRVHLFGSFNVARAAAPIFREQEFGAYVHFVSASGLIGNLGQANYSAAKMGILGLSNSIALDMRRYGVRSNCIVPFAWSRLTGSLPDRTPEERRRLERFRAMTPDKIAPLVAYLLSDAAVDVNGQVFSVRNNEMSVFSLPRPVRTIHRSDGWTPDRIAEMMPALESHFQELQHSADVFSWDPV